MADPAVSAVMVHRLDAVGVPIAELSLRAISLDDVFLAITGSAARAPASRLATPPAPVDVIGRTDGYDRPGFVHGVHCVHDAPDAERIVR